jgi:hypothetical protein
MKVDVTSASGPSEDAPKTPETPNIKTSEIADFKTPEQIAASDNLVATEPTAETVPATVDSRVSSWRSRLNLQWPPRRKEYTVAAVLAVLVIGGIAAALTYGGSDKPVAVIKAKPAVVKPKPAPKPTIVPSTLTGLPVDPSVNQRPVTAVMVENSLDARPQSGLSQAGVVFEAIAEGGVTRFMAVYQDTQPDDVGPIRSARPYYVSWALGFDAGYAHVGGSPDGLADIRAWGARDLDQFANSGSYHRIDTRSAPHNVYTGIPTLTQLEINKGYTTSTYSGFVRKVAAPSAAPTAKSIDFGLSGYYYNPHFDYNATTNSYDRSEAGAAHIDQSTGKPLSPNVVVAMVTPLGRGELDSSDAYYSVYAVVGSGAAYIFQDGIVTIGTWTKASNNAQIVFTDAAGKPLGLNPGQTWLTAVNTADGVSYNP